MNKKDIEAKFEIHQNILNTLNERYDDLYNRVRSLERSRDLFLSNDFKTPNQARENVGMSSLKIPNNVVTIDTAEFSKNKCPFCGSHHLIVNVSDNPVYMFCQCVNCGGEFGQTAILTDDKSAFEQIEEIQDVNKKLSKEIEELHRINGGLDREIKRVKENNNCLRDANKTIRENAAKLTKEKEELIKALNIYQAITDVDYNFMNDTAMVRLNGADGAGRAFIHDGDAARALYSAYVKYHDNSFKYKPGEKPDYKMTKKEKDEWIDRDMIASACYAMESLAKSADALATHLQKRQVYLANPKSLKVPVEFMLEDARYNFPFLREKRVWALDTCRTNVIRIVVMYGKAYCYDFNKQSLTPIDALMED